MLVFVCYLCACVLLPCDCGCWLVYIAWGAPDYTKRVRPDSGGVVVGPFPQRPGEKMCAYYMTTRNCSFGTSCRFDHPTWVPVGGIANWKEVCQQSEHFCQKNMPECWLQCLLEVGRITVSCTGLQSLSGKIVRFGNDRNISKAMLVDVDTQVTASVTPTDPATLPQRPGETVCAVSI
jgi:hypothetical protein